MNRIFLSLFSLVLFVSFAGAQETGKIAVIDLADIIANSSQGKKIQKDLQNDLKKSQIEFDKKKKSFEESVKGYEDKRDSFSEKVKAEKEDELMKKQRELQREAADMQEELNKKRDAALQDIYKKVIAVVEDISKKEGYSVVLDKKQAIYSTDSIDITSSVSKSIK